MLAGAGRPRKACSRCKGHKIRCTGEKPACKRCTRLKHTCIYDTSGGRDDGNALARTPSKSANTRRAVPSQMPPSKSKTAPDLPSQQSLSEPPIQTWRPLPLRRDIAAQNPYLGIPMSLVLTLVDVYYDNAYNASLLLSRRHFLESLATGTACHHVVLSVCAFALNFYPHDGDYSALREHSFSTEWAEQAGKLAFQDIENPTEDHIVTFLILALFWYSQGAWRRTAIHKGNATQISHVFGLGTERPGTQDSFEAEVRRRRFWACYLMHCHANETCFSVASNVTTKLTLPWTEEDYEAGLPRQPRVCLASVESNGGIFCELVRALNFWSEVNTLVKSTEASMAEKLRIIYTLDEQISAWWTRLPEQLRLTPSKVPQVIPRAFPNLMLLHMVYHQCLCALHASIVPLFCWSAPEATWVSARQTSAQVAFDHACAASALLGAAVASSHKLSALPSFVAYTAYSGCAIQIPFLWSSNPSIKQKVKENVRANVKTIEALAKHWKFTELLASHVRCIYKIHAKQAIVLEDEPKLLKPERLINFSIRAKHASMSILGHNNILWTTARMLPRSGNDSFDLGIEEDDSQRPVETDLPRIEVKSSSHRRRTPEPQPEMYCFSLPMEDRDHHRDNVQTQTYMESYQQQPTEQHFQEIESLDFFRPFHDPEMLDVFPHGQPMQFPYFQTSPATLDFWDQWSSAGDATSGL